MDFHELLDREVSGNSTLGTPAIRAAASEQALGEDPLVADLGERLRARGARVWHHYDGALDIAAAADPVLTIGRDDSEIPTPVAIESDGTERYRRMSVRERSRLRPQLLERMGWRYMSLWTIEVFTDPSSCADRIASYLGLENVGRKFTEAEQGFLDQQVDDPDAEEPDAEEPEGGEAGGGQLDGQLEEEHAQSSPGPAAEAQPGPEKQQEAE